MAESVDGNFVRHSPANRSRLCFDMRFLVSKVVVLVFLLHFRKATVNEVDTGLSKTKQDEWNNLLSWFRELKTKGNESEMGGSGLFDVTHKEEEVDKVLEDEAFIGNSRILDPAGEWDKLVNGESTTEDQSSHFHNSTFGDEDADGERTIRGASLAFVFDSTGSMRDELNQVKAGASKILAALRDHPDAPIYNYIWVPFSDPVIGPITVTTDPKLFQERMQDMMVFGGGDCPEMSIGAIKKALEASLPNSYIYVFTDASAKDYRLQNEVLSLVQRKQAQVVFILTGDCMDLSEPNYKVYERIAGTSSGQIYRLSRNEVREVLKYVKVALQPHVVSLVSLNKPAPNKTNPDKLTVVIDESLKQFTVSVSGVNANINVTDPKGVTIDGPPKLEKVLNLTNIKVVNVKEPDPGSWSVFINSDSDYTIRSTGLSKINFNHGFSTVETVNLKETNYRPLKGAKSFILIQTSDTERVHNLTTVDFVDLSGQVLLHLNLEPVPGMAGLYKGGSFVPPQEFFYLGVTGYGQDGLLVKRITSTAISGQLPEKPIITMRTKALGRVNSPGSLKCYVESVVPFTVRWFKNGVFLEREQNCSETCEAILNIERFTIESEGSYSCSARNVAGSDSKTLVLTITGDAPSVTVKNTVVAFLGQTVHLDCLVHSKIPYVVKWAQFTAKNQHSGVLHPSSIGIKLANNTLLIESVKSEDEGWYVCIAANQGGESQGRVLLIIKEPLVVKVEPNVVTFAEGDSFRLTCSAWGKPQPRLEWIKDQQKIQDEDPSIFVEEINGNLNLVFDYSEKKNSGVYVCNAVNTEESASASVELIYTEKPRIRAKENNIMVKVESEVVLKCTATGFPKPTITWFKRENEIADDPRFQVEDDILRINSARLLDAGEYSCAAKNDLGSDVDYIGLIVGTPPSFLQKPKDKKIQINHNETVPCSAIGIPPPEIRWKKSDGQDLDPNRMFVLSSGALKITTMKFEDAGQYTCTVENVFGSISNSVSIKVTGIEKPTPDKNMQLTDVEAVSGSELIIPCGIILGNPPGSVKWFKNGNEIQPSDEVIIKSNGDLVIKNTTGTNRGNYLCTAQNAVGSSSRSYEILVSESPKIMQTNETQLKGRVGGEIVIPCPVEGFPFPTVVWTRNGLPLPMSSTIFQDESGSLIIRNLSEENTGVYVCTAINVVGSASKATIIHVQVPPKFPKDTQDSSVHVVEGHVVVLNCNVSAIPEPRIKWYKNGEPLLQDAYQPKILRFVANTDDTGIFECVAENEAGSASKEFSVTILVPPKIKGRNSEASIKAKAGGPITLLCDVYGVPAPTILWQRNGMYLTQNSSDVTISNSGSLTIRNVTKESTGAYTCDAENLGGITQRSYYLQVNYPPKIIEDANISKVITLKEGEEFSLTCVVEGNPKPQVLWRKNGLPIHDHQYDLVILEDNTLVFLQVTRETTGIYKCEAISSEGSTFKEHEIKVLVPPSLTSDSYPTRLEVNEGDSLALTCPTTSSIPPSNIQWIKNGEPLGLFLQERSDEAQMKLSLDQRTLTIVEAHPSDKGNYSCVATNLAGRTDARFLVDILMTPHFEEFNHVAHRTILTGGEVVLNCSVTGNPMPKVTWRKENTPITPHNTPGVHVSLDKQHLIIVNGKVHHTGTYICLATNKVNTKEREFYITVLEPPQITGPLQQIIDLMKGDNVTLDCQGNGVPPPTFLWTKQEETKKVINNSKNYLQIISAQCSDSGIYLCDVTNTAGTRTKYFELNVLELPHIENQEHIDEVTGIIGGNVTMKCKTNGTPKPEITWLHNGHILNKVRKRSIENYEDKYSGEWEFSDDGLVSLTLTNVQEQNKGTYTLLASNKAGVVEKKFDVKIIVPPQLLTGHEEIEHLMVIHPLPIILKCPVKGDPVPWFLWFYNDISGESLKGNNSILISGKELRIRRSQSTHAGVYVCVAENPGGRLAHYFNVTVVEPPKVEGSRQHSLDILVNETVAFYCNSTGNGEIKHTWFYGSVPLKNSTEVLITELGKKLTISAIQLKDSGVYYCIATNAAGSTEIAYNLDVHEPPTLSDQFLMENHRTVQLHHPFSLYCFFIGYPPPEITWLKDGKLFDRNYSENSVGADNSYLSFSSSKPEHSGNYKCVARNKGGVRELNFKVDVVVLGEWGHWSDWSSCSVACGLGVQIRKRSCNVENMNLDPRLKIDKTKCKGEDERKKTCFNHCQVNGGWSMWSSWTSCSETCGKGIRKRKRVCDNPKPENNGKECVGDGIEEEHCLEKECPINGQWSGWSEWSVCSDSCGGGVMQRVRKCNSPPPQHDGEECVGWGSEIKICNRNKCQDNGRWMPWSEWSACSETCGKGYKRRHRSCKLSTRGGTCRGENLQIEKCFIQSCYNFTIPSSANLFIKGNLNGNPIDNRIDVSIENLANERQISVNTNNILQQKNKWFPYAPFLLSPLSWNAAYENDNADNGYTLTDGNFFSQSDIKFASGEELTMKHKGDGVDQNGTLIVNIEVIGEVPLVEPHASVIIRPFEQDFVQTGLNTLYASTQNNVTIEGRDLPFSWNSSVNYDVSKGTMPYLVETLSTKEILHEFNPESQNISFAAASTIGKKFEDNRCPPGFLHDRSLMHCQDINECEITKTLCKSDEVCENTFGSYKCVCRKGFQKTELGCRDVDECSKRGHYCSHFCHNTLGSYKCSCPFGFFLAYDLKTCVEMSERSEETFYDEDYVTKGQKLRGNLNVFGNLYHDNYDRLQEYRAIQSVACPPGYFFINSDCKDYNECEDSPNICDKDETCINFPGSYQCLSIPCPLGYQRIYPKKNCVKMCRKDSRCLRGASVSESIIFHPVTLNRTTGLIVHLNDISEPLCNAVKTRYRVIESNEKFEIQVSNEQSSLVTSKKLNKETLYRVKVEAFSYDTGDVLLYFTEFVIFLVVV